MIVINRGVENVIIMILMNKIFLSSLALLKLASELLILILGYLFLLPPPQSCFVVFIDLNNLQNGSLPVCWPKLFAMELVPKEDSRKTIKEDQG